MQRPIQSRLQITTVTKFCELSLWLRLWNSEVGLSSRSAVSEAWLGPSYQMSGSLNGTFLGGEQQPIHRDYREFSLWHKSYINILRSRCQPSICRADSKVPPRQTDRITIPNPAMGNRTYRYANGNRTDPVHGILANIRERIHSCARAGIHRLHCTTYVTARIEKGRWRLFQSGDLPSAGNQHHRSRAGGQPASGELGFREGDGVL